MITQVMMRALRGYAFAKDPKRPCYEPYPDSLYSVLLLPPIFMYCNPTIDSQYAVRSLKKDDTLMLERRGVPLQEEQQFFFVRGHDEELTIPSCL